MSAIPGMNDTAIGVLVVLLVFGFCFIATMVYILLPKHPRPMAVCNGSSDRSAWGAGILAAAALLALWSWTGTDERRVRIADYAKPTPGRGAAPVTQTPMPDAKRIPERGQIVTLTDCPPPAPGLTDTIVMVIKSHADRQPAVTRCSRIAERPQRKFRGKPIVAEAK